MTKLLAILPIAFALAAVACGPGKTVASPIDVADPAFAHGKELYTANCNKCHGYADPHLLADDKWPEMVEEMGTKAKLEAADRQAVLQYILAAKKQ